KPTARTRSCNPPRHSAPALPAFYSPAPEALEILPPGLQTAYSAEPHRLRQSILTAAEFSRPRTASGKAYGLADRCRRRLSPCEAPAFGGCCLLSPDRA